METMFSRHGFTLLDIRPAPPGRVAGGLVVPQFRWDVLNQLGCRLAGKKWFLLSSRRRDTRCYRDWSSDVCSSDLSARVFDLMRFFAMVSASFFVFVRVG